MPQVGAFFMGALGVGAAPALGTAAFGAWTAGISFAGTTLGGIAVKLLTSVALSALSMAIQGKPSQQAAGIRTDQTLTGGVNPEAFILGRYATNGVHVAPYMSHGSAGKTPNAYLTYVIEVGGIPGHTLAGLILNGEAVEILEDGPHADYGKRIGGRYIDRAWIKYYDGRQTAADPMLVAKYPAPHVRPWAADMIGTGVCYAILTFQYDREAFQSWPTVRFVVDGIPLYDPRKDSTQPGGLGAQRWSDPATWAQTSNAVVQIYNVKRGIRLPSGEIWGGDIPAADLPLANWISAMDAADNAVSDGDGGTEPQYRAGLEVLVEDEPWTVIEELLAACSGALAETGGVWTIRAGAPGLPVMAIHDDDLLADAPDDFKPFPTMDGIYNAIEATYPDPESSWESRDADPITNEAWEAEDGGRRLTASLSLPVVPYPVQVQRLMSAMIADHRRMRTHVITLPPEALVLEALDVIAWTSPSNGYEAKLFEVKTAERDPQTGRVTVTLREVDPEDYDPPAGLTRPAPPDRRPLLPTAQAVPGWSVAPWRIKDADGADRRPGVRLSWNADAADDARGIRWAIRLGGDTGTGTESAMHDPRGGFAEVELLPATVYEIRARLVVDRPTEWSDWLSVLTPDVRIGAQDVTDDIAADLATLHGWLDAGLVDLPVQLTALAQQIADEAIARIAAIQAMTYDLDQEVIARAAAVQDLADDLAAEIATREAALAETAGRWRQHRDQIRHLMCEVVELASRDHAAREEIRRSLTVQLGAMGASFAEQIITLADAEAAAALRITSLEATSGTLDAKIQQAEIARIDGYNALSAMIAQLSVGSAVTFDHAVIWYWDAEAEGWTGSPAAPSVTDGWLRPGAASDAVSPAGLAIDGAAYKQLRAHLRKAGSPVWQGYVWWASEGQPWDASRRVEAPEPLWDAGEAQLTVNLPWTGGIDRLRLELVAEATAVDYVELDWLAVGRPAPGASSADLLAERSARIEGDAVLAQDIVSLEARMSDAEGTMDAQAGAISGLSSRVDDTEDGITAQSQRIDDLTAQVFDPTTGLSGLASAIDVLEANAAVADGSQVQQAQAMRALRSVARSLAAEGIEGAARDHARTQAVRDYIASATQSLNTRVDLTDAQVLIQADAITKLQSAIPGLATVDALQSLQTTLQERGLEIDALSQSITDLSTVVDGKASAGALDSLTNRVTITEGAVTAQGDRLTSLESEVTDPANGLASKASGTALTSLSNRVTATENEIDALGQDVTTLQAEVADKASSAAVTALTNRVTVTEDQIDVLGQDITTLQGEVDGKASGTAVSALTNRVTDAEDGIVAQGQRIDNLTQQVTDPVTGLTGLANAIDLLEANATVADGSQVQQAQAIRSLRSVARSLAAEGLEGAARDHARTQAVRDYIASATQALNTRVDLTDSQVLIVASAVVKLEAAIPGLASLEALQSLQTTLDVRGLEIDALSLDLTSLSANVDGKAEQTAVASLTNRVAVTEGQIDTLGQSVTTLQGEVAGKASGAALTSLSNRVTEAEDTLTTQGSAITSLNNTLENPSTGLASRASSTAVNALTSRVDDTEGVIDALSEALIDLGVMSPAGVAQTILKMTAESSPAGVLARIGLRALVGDSSDNTRVAAMFLEALAGEQSRVVFEADRFTVASGAARETVFEIVGGQVYLRSARIKDASIDTLKIGAGAVTVPVTTYIPGVITPPATGGAWANIAQCYIMREGYPTRIDFRSALDCYSPGVMRMRVVRTVGSTLTNLQPGDWFQSIDWGQTQTGFAFTDFDTGTGVASYTVQAQRAHPDLTGGRNGVLRMFQRYLAIQQVKR